MSWTRTSHAAAALGAFRLQEDAIAKVSSVSNLWKPRSNILHFALFELCSRVFTCRRRKDWRGFDRTQKVLGMYCSGSKLNTP